MSPRLSWYYVCLLVLGCATTAPMTGNTPVQAEVPPCTPGELLFAPSYLPLDLVPTPDGRSLVVVDRGFLALREPTTLKVQRYLLPQVDGWVSASFSPDGRTLTAQTFDGQRYAFDTSTWKAERLTDARVFNHEREQADVELMNARVDGLKFLAEDTFQRLPGLLREFALQEEAMKQNVMPLVLAQDDSRQRLLIGEVTGALTLVDLAGQRILQRVACEKCSPYIYLRAEADGFLGVTADGRLRVLDRELKVVRDAGFLPPQERPVAQRVPGEREAPSAPRPRLIRRLLRVGDGSRLAWLTRDHEMGLFDLGTGTQVVRLPPLGLGGATLAALLDARRMVLLSEGTLRIWDMPEQRVLVETQGPFSSGVRIDAERVLVTREDGFAEVLSTHSGEVLRRFCATHLPCGRVDEQEMHRRVERIEQAPEAQVPALSTELLARMSPRYVGLLVSPDQHTLVAVSYPSRAERGGLTATGSIGAWRLPGLEPLGMRPLSEDEVDGEVRFGPEGTLFSGGEPLSVPGLPTATPISPRGDGTRRYSGGALTVAVHPASPRSDFYDEVLLLESGAWLRGVIAVSTVTSRRGQLRRETFADVLPSGERFLIASGPWEAGTHFGGLRSPSGPTQVWCSPRETLLPRFPEAPPPPEVVELDGVAEVSLAAVPRQYESMAATGDGTAYLLARDMDSSAGPSNPPTLWRLTPGSPRAERLELPSAPTTWERLATAPDDGSLWVLGREALAHREADGQWTVQPFRIGDAEVKDFLALPGGGAVVVRQHEDLPWDGLVHLQFIIARSGRALSVTELAGSGTPMPLVPLPDGFLFPGTREPGPLSGRDPRHNTPPVMTGLRFRDGNRVEADAFLARVRGLQPQRAWLRGDRVLLLSETPSRMLWVEMDARTGEVLKRQDLEQLFRTPGNVTRLDLPAARTDREPLALGATEETEEAEAPVLYELPQWVDHQGRVLATPQRSIPTWLGGAGGLILEAASTPKGTWLLLSGNVLLFWDGARLSAYFHPDTRQDGLRFAD